MITFIYGGSSSGKSAFAESLLSGLDDEKKYYLATMDAYDSESILRIKRHKKAREGKGFCTIECPCDIYKAGSQISVSEGSAVLLECMSNLLANEMFRDGKIMEADRCADKIIKDFENLMVYVRDMIIVSNNIFEDGNIYDDGTRAYLAALGLINRRLAAISDEVYEVVVGIPVRIK